jgi:hypothetical protein
VVVWAKHGGSVTGLYADRGDWLADASNEAGRLGRFELEAVDRVAAELGVADGEERTIGGVRRTPVGVGFRVPGDGFGQDAETDDVYRSPPESLSPRRRR